jgi:hypothetical protein
MGELRLELLARGEVFEEAVERAGERRDLVGAAHLEPVLGIAGIAVREGDDTPRQCGDRLDDDPLDEQHDDERQHADKERRLGK